ncbi:MAG: toll/interleukin-1 receptor domain-containing protein [Acidobacteria bacterium]|nr:toll/interleukin-1 receptor domain-containing protein [Acidobacteriota bacterium]
MVYAYSFDKTPVGDRWWFKNTYTFYQKGLKRLRTLLDDWKKRAGTEMHPYAQEVEDLTNMIEWADQRLAGIATDNDPFFVRGISRGSMRYLKAGAMLQVLEKQNELAGKLVQGIPAGVAAAIRRDIEEMQAKADLLPIDPADCLWEVIARPAAAAPGASESAATPAAPATVAVRRPSAGKKWDFFISYATEDAELAQSLAEALGREGYTVWYDRFILTAGDSLLARIDEGLARSSYGVVILSHDFFRKPWPKKELAGLAAREATRRDKKVVLPVWHGLSAADVRKYSPLLADRVGIPTKDGVDFIVGELRRAIRPRTKTTKPRKT